MRPFLVFAAISAILSAAVLLVLGAAGPTAQVLGLALTLALLCLAFGPATGDYSWVDRIWSVAPVAFAWILATAAGPRAFVAALLVSLWGARLTFNFARRGGYSGMEDYRWSVLRQRITRPLAWQAFNALFIAGFQVAVLVLITLPIGRLAADPGRPFTPAFVALALLALAFLAWETVADGQQWRFQGRKDAARAARERGEVLDPALAAELDRGFCDSGLFRLSRHPNYFGELGFWWTVWLLSSEGTTLAHASIAGVLALTAVFLGSTRFTEELSSAKYPAYRAYQASTSAVLPWFRREADEAAASPVAKN